MSIKIKTLSINPKYKIYSDGRLWNLKRSSWVNGYSHSKIQPKLIIYQIFNVQTMKYEKIARHRLKRFEFENHGYSHHSELCNIKKNEH